MQHQITRSLLVGWLDAFLFARYCLYFHRDDSLQFHVGVCKLVGCWERGEVAENARKEFPCQKNKQHEVA